MDLSVPPQKKFGSDSAYLSHMVTTAEAHANSIRQSKSVDIQQLRDFYFITSILLKKIGRHLTVNDPTFFVMKGAYLEVLASTVKHDFLSGSYRRLSQDVGDTLTLATVKKGKEEEQPVSPESSEPSSQALV